MALRTASTMRVHPGESPQIMLRIGDDRDIQVAQFEIEREDVLKFKPLYEALHDQLYELGFTHPHSNDDKFEDLYWERWTPAGAKEQHIWWRMRKDINPYIRYFIELNYQTLNATKTEVPYKNKKATVEKIDLILRLRAFLQWDIEDRFENSVAGRLKKLFFNRLYVDEIEQHKIDLLQLVEKIRGLIKGFVEQTHETPVDPNFQPVMGYKEPIGSRPQ